MAEMARCMWRSPSAKTNSFAGRRTSLRTELPSKGATIGNSVYFRDPDGHLLELATPGLWWVY